jgi:hypothetical protein
VPARLPDDSSARGRALPEAHASRHSPLPQDASNLAATPPYTRRARGGPPVRPRSWSYMRRPRRRSTADAPPSSPAVTRARVYIRAPCVLLPHAIPSRQPRRAAPLPPPPESRLLRPSPFQLAPLASPLGPSAPPRVAHCPPRAVYSLETAPPRPPPSAAVELPRRRPPCPNPGH